MLMYIYCRTFHLKLRPLNFYKTIFSDSHVLDIDGVYYSNVIRPYDFIYEGHLSGSVYFFKNYFSINFGLNYIQVTLIQMFMELYSMVYLMDI